MERYEQYKDSGVEWIGEIPEKWSCERLKYLATINDDVLPETTDANFQLKYIDISSVKNGAGIINSENYSFANAPSRARRIVRHGDVIVSTVRTYLKSIAKIENPDDNLIVSTGFAVIRPQKINYNYIGYVFYSEHLIGEIISRSTGVGYPAINALEVGNIPIPIPRLDEQINIANYLDHKTAEIDALISQKEHLLELYEEKKAAIINQAVTKGIDPDVELVDSGVEWLGETPKGWKVKKLKYLTAILRGKFTHRPRNDERFYGGKYPFIQTGDVTNSGKFIKDYKQTLNEKGYYVSQEFPSGTLVMTIAANVGDVSILDFDACFPDSIIGFYPKETVSVDFLYYKFISLREKLLGSSTQNTQQNLNIDRISPIEIAVPRNTKEQKLIVEYIESEIARIDAKISKTKRIIELQKEYRAALISEVVTGKVKVPESYHQEATP